MRIFTAFSLLIGALATFTTSAADTTEQRLIELEQKLAALEKNTSSSTPSANAFNPAISLIFSGLYASHSGSPDDYAIPGFNVAEESLPPAEGFSLGETEMTISAHIDDKFFGQTTIAFANEDGETVVETEEAFIQTAALHDGLTLKAGRFLSGIGYLNHHHAHTDLMIDRPLVYSTFIDHHLGDDGVQLRYVLPFDLYTEIGAESLRGDSYPAAGATKNGKGSQTLFVRTGGDFLDGGSYLLGLSHLTAHADELALSNTDLFNGKTDMNIVDVTLKWSPQGNKRFGQWILRGEWFSEKRDGILLADSSDWKSQRDGFYIEAHYQSGGPWSMGLRTDQLTPDANAPAPLQADDHSQRYSVVTAWRNSEFSRIQLQYNRGDSVNGEIFSSWLLQYQMALGAHGAHKF